MNWYEIPIRLGLSVLCGVLVGFERERRHRPAGIKTHALVCLGAALVSLIQIYMLEEVVTRTTANPELAAVLKSDYGRLGAQVISGIGFLGAGAILKSRASLHGLSTIQGLSTAATLWIVACVGLAVGMGYYDISLTTMAFIFLVIVGARFVQKAVQKKTGLKKLEVTFLRKKEGMNFINEYCVFRNITIRNIQFIPPHDEAEETEASEENAVLKEAEERFWTYEYTLFLPRGASFENIVAELQMENDIVSATDPSENHE